MDNHRLAPLHADAKVITRLIEHYFVSPWSENIKKRFRKTLLLYLGILISLQLIGIAYIIEEPSPHRAILVAIILGTVLPLLLGLMFLRLIKLG